MEVQKNLKCSKDLCTIFRVSNVAKPRPRAVCVGFPNEERRNITHKMSLRHLYKFVYESSQPNECQPSSSAVHEMKST